MPDEPLPTEWLRSMAAPNERERSLREQVAEIVGWVYRPPSRHHCPKCGYARSSQRHEATCTMRVSPPPYDTSADAALEAWAPFFERGWRINHYGSGPNRWEASIWRPDQMAITTPECAALPLAICQAIVAAHGREKT